MKVRFVRPRTPDSGEDDSSFELGKIYLVLGIQFQPAGPSPMVTIQRDTDKTPVMRELQCFEVVDATVPDEWCLFDFGDGVYCLEPKEFGGIFGIDFMMRKTMQKEYSSWWWKGWVP